jgi:hypothetical protein
MLYPRGLGRKNLVFFRASQRNHQKRWKKNEDKYVFAQVRQSRFRLKSEII